MTSYCVKERQAMMNNDVKEREETLCMQVLGNMDNPEHKEILSKDALKF